MIVNLLFLFSLYFLSTSLAAYVLVRWTRLGAPVIVCVAIAWPALLPALAVVYFLFMLEEWNLA